MNKQQTTEQGEKPKRMMLTGNDRVDEMNEEHYQDLMKIWNQKKSTTEQGEKKEQTSIELFNKFLSETPKEKIAEMIKAVDLSSLKDQPTIDEYFRSFGGSQPIKEGEEERILCAAIYFNDGKEHPHQPKNIETGFVITGRRHHNCYATFSAIGKSLGVEGIAKNQIERIDRDGQGFITNLDRYVDRKEGYLIAKTAGQLLHNLHDQSNPILISEDLY